MSKPRLLDLFCGAGGAAMGYHRAGFEVVGVDIAPQPHYPFEFHQADALEFLTPPLAIPSYTLANFDAIHASPPCQYNTTLRALQGGKEYPNLIPQTRDLLLASGKPFIMENVEGAPLLRSTVLCGTSFGLPLRRHRIFESNLVLFGVPCNHKAFPKRFPTHRHYTTIQSRFVQVYGSPGGKTPELWNEAMGIDWMDRKEITQAIPPAYTEFLGEQLLRAVEIAA